MVGSTQFMVIAMICLAFLCSGCSCTSSGSNARRGGASKDEQENSSTQTSDVEHSEQAPRYEEDLPQPVEAYNQ